MKNILLALTITFLVTASYATAELKPSSRTTLTDTISVAGNGMLEVMPDQATINFVVMTKSKASRDAQNQNAAETNRLVSALTEAYRLPKTQIKTTSYTVTPEYDSTDSRTLIGYVVRHELAIQFKFVDGLGSVLDLALASGATTIEYIHYGLQDSKEVEKQTLRLAMQDSLAKATIIAESAGRSIIRVIKVSEGQYAFSGADKSAADDREPGTEIYPLMVTVSANLNVIYKF